jgi:tRNA pseudouridine38-40 synthase
VGQRSVQQTLEEALSRVANAPIRVHAAGRTDAGVHATQQIVGFATPAVRPSSAWTRGVNSLMPNEVRVRWVEAVPAHFHPRFSATARRYLYVVLESEQAPAIARQCVTWSARRLDDAAMHGAAQLLVGEHDFTTFRSAACQSRSPYRCVFSIAVRRFDDLVVLDVTANAFLHHMIRNIAAALMQVGAGDREPRWMGAVLIARDRALIGPTAPSTGLYLVDVQYGAEFAFPRGGTPMILKAAGDVW